MLRSSSRQQTFTIIPTPNATHDAAPGPQVNVLARPAQPAALGKRKAAVEAGISINGFDAASRHGILEHKPAKMPQISSPRPAFPQAEAHEETCCYLTLSPASPQQALSLESPVACPPAPAAKLPTKVKSAAQKQLETNRIAQRRYRERKKLQFEANAAQAAELGERVKSLTQDNQALKSENSALKEEVASLKELNTGLLEAIQTQLAR